MTIKQNTTKYIGPVKAVIFDMAGTTIDYGSCAPAGSFIELFKRHKINVNDRQAREPMGLHKRDHIKAISIMPEIENQWQIVYGRQCEDEDIDRLYAEFIPIQIENLPRYSELIPGTVEVISQLQDMGIKVGLTTGYNREMMNIVLEGFYKEGVRPDTVVCAEEVAKGRPAPWMIYNCMQNLGVYPVNAVVKIGDTIPDIESGLNAGCWSIGVAKTGNMLGMNLKKVNSLEVCELQNLLDKAHNDMFKVGAHAVVNELEGCIDIIKNISDINLNR
ncbi:MAG: phosphonoacetaldehyde hydrolase [bacterium]|nr:phosphonoacetaldehyde hydrolase [bacterium]